MTHNHLFSVILLLFVSLASWAQEYTPNTNWPYLLPDFQQGTLYLKSGGESTGDFNIHLHGNHLQCVTLSGHINKVQTIGATHVRIGDTDYRYIGDQLMATVEEIDSVTFLLYNVVADYDAMLRSRMPYGMTGSTSATEDVKRLNMKGISNERYAEMRAVWYDGQQIPLVSTYMFLINDRLIPATAKGCNAALDAQGRKALKALLKKDNLKWQNVADLKVILKFVASRLQPED